MVPKELLLLVVVVVVVVPQQQVRQRHRGKYVNDGANGVRLLD
jgi:hypothetical protein